MRIIILLFLSLSIGAQESSWNDLKTSVKWLFQGSYLQFSQPQNIPYLAVGIPSTWYALEHDKRLSNSFVKRSENKLYDLVSDSSVVLNLPVIPILTYYVGRKIKSLASLQWNTFPPCI